MDFDHPTSTIAKFAASVTSKDLSDATVAAVVPTISTRSGVLSAGSNVNRVAPRAMSLGLQPQSPADVQYLASLN